MRKLSSARSLFFPALAAGAAGGALRFALYRTGFDHRGLLPLYHPLQLLCVGIALALAVYLLIHLRQETEVPPLHGGTPAGIAAALTLGLNAWQLIPGIQGDYLDIMRVVFAFLCAIGVAGSTLVRFRGSTPGLSIQTAVCLFFPLDMLCRYQLWSGNPRLADYCFALPASVFLCVTTYHSLALSRGLGSRKIQTFAGLMALCLCLYSLVGSGSPVFYLGGALLAWAELGAPREKEAEDHVSA